VIFLKRIRISNIKKFLLMIRSFIQSKLNII